MGGLPTDLTQNPIPKKLRQSELFAKLRPAAERFCPPVCFKEETMPYNSNRVERISEEVTRELAMMLRDVKDPRVSQCMLSVVRCEVTNDMRWCKVFLSALGDYDQKELKKGLKSCSGYLRRELAHRLRLRYTPELTFILDDSIAHGAHIAAVLNTLDIPEDLPEDEDEQ